MSGLYGLALTAFLLVRRRLTDRVGWVTLGNSFLHLLLLPALALLPLSALMRRRIAALSLIAPVWTFARDYGPLFMPRQAPKQSPNPGPDGPPFTLLTYNLHADQTDLDPMIALIREADADIVALQELSIPTAERFAEVFAAEYPYQALHPQDFPNAGQGILSRYPILADAYWRNEGLPVHVALGHQRIEIEIEDAHFTLYNVHPVHPGMSLQQFDARPREREVNILLARANEETGAVFLCGDFNMTDQTDDYQRITARYTDTFREVGRGMGFTFPDLTAPHTRPDYLSEAIHWKLRPIVRLDYVFYNGDAQGLAARVWPTSGGSDHRPVLAELALEL